MKIPQDGYLLRVFIGEADQWHGKPLYEAIVLKARELHLAGATVLRGPMGFGANSRLHTTKILRLSEDLPIVVEIVDAKEKIDLLMPHIDEMVQEGLVMSMTGVQNSLLKIRQLNYFTLNEEEPVKFDFDAEKKTVDLTVIGEEAERTELQFGGGWSEVGAAGDRQRPGQLQNIFGPGIPAVNHDHGGPGIRRPGAQGEHRLIVVRAGTVNRSLHGRS